MNICRGLSGLVGKFDETGLPVFKNRKITLRVSADEVGMTLSLVDETGPDPTIFLVPLEPVADELRRVLKSHQDAAKDDAPDQPAPSVAVGRGDILDKAKSCVCQDRNREYGEPEDGFKLIAALWEPVIRESCVSPGADVSVGPETVALLMALLEIARMAQNEGASEEEG